MESPCITVGILVYQKTEGLEETLHSILSQESVHMEIIISDDASPNIHVEELRNHVAALAGYRVQVRQNKENLGIVAHSNLIGNLAKNDYIKLMAPGDVFIQIDALSRLWAFSAETDAPVIFAQMRMGETSRLFPSKHQLKILRCRRERRLFSALAFRNIIAVPTALYKRKFFAELGGFDEEYRYLEDWPTWLRLARAGYPLPSMDYPCVMYALDGISNTPGGVFASELLRADMMLCYNKDIFPYSNIICYGHRYVISYYYALLTGTNKKLRYLPLQFLRWCKKTVSSLCQGE